MLQELLDVFHEIHSLHKVLFGELLKTREKIQDGRTSQFDLVDAAYILKQIQLTAEEIRKDADSFVRLTEKVICLRWIVDTQMNPESGSNIKAEFATGTPDVKMRVKLPTRRNDKANWTKLMKWLGADEFTIQNELVDVRWPQFQELIRQRNEEGLPVPPGVDLKTQYPEHSVRLTPRKKGGLERIRTVEEAGKDEGLRVTRDLFKASPRINASPSFSMTQNFGLQTERKR